MMITREGMETALLVTTALFQLKSSAVLLGLALGLAAAIGICFAWSRLGRGVDIRALLNVSSVFLSIFLVQLLLYGVHELAEARLFPSSQAIHDATEILGPDGKIGHLLAYSLAVDPDGMARGAVDQTAQPRTCGCGDRKSRLAEATDGTGGDKPRPYGNRERRPYSSLTVLCEKKRFGKAWRK